MKILYVGALSIPIQDILNGKTENEITGFPAYFYPVYKLIKKGHSVDFATVSSMKNYNINVEWFKESQIVSNIYQDPDKIRKMSSLRRKIYVLTLWVKHILDVNRVVKRNKYDFIYCQDHIGVFGNIIAAIHKIPCGMRLYGDTFQYKSKIITKYDFIKKNGKFKLLISKPFVYLSYKIKKSFMLTTADGTRGDLTYSILKPRKDKYEFFFWSTGVNKECPKHNYKLEKILAGQEYICFPARIDNIKRQDRVIRVLRLLHNRGIKIHLYLIGQVCDSAFFDSLKELSRRLGLDEYVHFTGGINQNDLKIYTQKSIATVLTSNCSNRGNVFFEAFSIGAPIISLDDGSISDIIIHKYNGFLAKSLKEIVDYIVMLINNPELKRKISDNAIKTADKKVLSLDDRFDLEIELITRCAKGNTLDCLPNRI